MHPVMPFVTEALWAHVSAARSGSVAGLTLPSAPLVVGAAWPSVDPALVDPTVLADFERADSLVAMIRSLRASQGVKPRQQISLHAPASVRDLIATTGGYVEALAGVRTITDISKKPAVASPIAFEGQQVLLSGLTDEIDLPAERARLGKTIETKAKQVAGFEAKLNNAGYVKNAKPELVAETREKLAAATADLAAARAALAALPKK
jgi:valyl-tRNA synthetase